MFSKLWYATLDEALSRPPRASGSADSVVGSRTALLGSRKPDSEHEAQGRADAGLEADQARRVRAYQEGGAGVLAEQARPIQRQSAWG